MNTIESIRYNNGNFFKKGKRQMTEGKITVEIQLLLGKRIVSRIPVLSFTLPFLISCCNYVNAIGLQLTIPLFTKSVPH